MATPRIISKSDCIVLPLVLKKKWYDMIASGEKREEYRDYKPFWTKRIYRWLMRCLSEGKQALVSFSCGYRPASMWFVVTKVDCKDDCQEKHIAWGEPNTIHFAIHLDERVLLNAEDQSI